jgi:chromate transporter
MDTPPQSTQQQLMNTPERSISLFELFKGFATIGVLGFGGVAVMARHVIVEQYQWLTEKEYATILGMGQVLPGANVVNASVVIGDRFQGPKGSIVCVLGIMVLPIMILLAFAMLYDQFAQLPAVSVALTGAGAAAAGMVLATGLKMAIKVKLDLAGWLIAGFAILGILVWQLPMVYVVLALIPTALVITAWLGKK